MLVGVHAQRAALAALIDETFCPDVADAQFAAEGRFDDVAGVIEAEIAPAIEPFLIDDFEDRMIERLGVDEGADRSEEHTSELQSLMRISYAVFCLKKKKK